MQDSTRDGTVDRSARHHRVIDRVQRRRYTRRDRASWRPLFAVLPALLLAACSSGGNGAEPTVTPAPSPGPGPQPGSPGSPSPTYKVRGDVFAHETGMVADADISLWVHQGGGWYVYSYQHGSLKSDGVGRFETAPLPASTIWIVARKPGYVQPCAVRENLRSDVEVRVELVPRTAFDTVDAPRPQLSVEPTLTGVIYETTATGRRPVAGAGVVAWTESDPEWSHEYADTTSDRSGAYFLCKLTSGVYLEVGATGFRSRMVGPIDGSVSTTLDIELQRQ